jgi:hypothetical protein
MCEATHLRPAHVQHAVGGARSAPEHREQRAQSELRHGSAATRAAAVVAAARTAAAALLLLCRCTAAAAGCCYRREAQQPTVPRPHPRALVVMAGGSIHIVVVSMLCCHATGWLFGGSGRPAMVRRR